MTAEIITPQRLRMSAKDDEAPSLPKRTTSQTLVVSSKLLLSRDSMHQRRLRKHRMNMTTKGCVDCILQPPKRRSIEPCTNEETEKKIKTDNNTHHIEDDRDDDSEDEMACFRLSLSTSTSRSSRTSRRRSSDPMHNRLEHYSHQKDPKFSNPLSTAAGRLSKSDETHNIGSASSNSISSRQLTEQLFVGRKIERSVSLGGERPCMKRSSLTCSMYDTAILRPYRKLSKENLFMQREESNDTLVTNDTNNSIEDIINTIDSDFESDDCECNVVPTLPEKRDLSTNDRSNTMNGCLSPILEVLRKQQQRQGVTKSRSFPMDMMTLRHPIMPLRQESIRNLCPDNNIP